MNARYRKAMRLRSRHHRQQPRPTPAPAQIAWAVEPCHGGSTRGVLPGTHTAEELDLHSQGLEWHQIKTMSNVDLTGRYL